MPKIKDNETGQIIEVSEEELGNYGIVPVQQSSPSQGGGINISPEMAMLSQIILPSNQASRIKGAYDIQQQQREYGDKLSKEQEEKAKGEEIKNQALTAAQELKKSNYGRITGAKSLDVMLGLPTGNQATINKFKNLKSLLSLDNIKYLKGALSDKDLMFLEQASSALNQNLTNEDFGKELDNIIGRLGGETTSTDTQSTLTGNASTDTLKSNPVIEFLLGKAINTANDIGMAGRVKSVQPEVDKLNSMVEELSLQANSVKDPKQKLELLKRAEALADEAIAISNENVQGFSQDVNEDPITRGFNTGLQVASTADIPALAVSGINLFKNIPGMVRGVPGKVLTQGMGSAMRNSAVEGAEQAGKIADGSKIVSGLKDWAVTAKNAHPNKSKVIDSMISTLDDTLGKGNASPKQLFSLWDEANNGWKVSKEAGRTLEASYHRALRDIIRKELDQIAPGFEKGTKMIAQGLQRADMLKGAGKVAGGAAVSGVTFALLNKLLNIGNSNQQL